MLHLLPNVWRLCKVIGRFVQSDVPVLTNLSVKASLSVICPAALLGYLRVGLRACLQCFVELCSMCSNFLRACPHCVSALLCMILLLSVGVLRECTEIVCCLEHESA